MLTSLMAHLSPIHTAGSVPQGDGLLRLKERISLLLLVFEQTFHTGNGFFWCGQGSGTMVTLVPPSFPPLLGKY